MEVGRVIESRAAVVAEGTLVAMAYGHTTRPLADPLAERVVPLPEELDPVLGVYVAHMGPICANGLLHAAADAAAATSASATASRAGACWSPGAGPSACSPGCWRATSVRRRSSS